jgi:hypothetical protein
MRRYHHPLRDDEAHTEAAKNHGRDGPPPLTPIISDDCYRAIAQRFDLRSGRQCSADAIPNGFSIRRSRPRRGQAVRKNARRHEDPLATLLLILARTDYFVVQALLEAIERDQLTILTATIQARTKLQLPYYSDGNRRKVHAS